MTASRIGEVSLRLRLPGELSADAETLRAQVEREVIIFVLEELERRVHATFGATAVIHVRHLSLAWRLGVEHLHAPEALQELAEELARDLAAALEMLPPPERLRPDSGSVVMFRDEHHAVAAWLADLADGRPRRWFHTARLDAVATWESVAAAGAEALTRVIEWLARMDRREEALALAPDRVAEAAVAAVPEVAHHVALERARRHSATPPSREVAGADSSGGVAPGAPADGSRETDVERPSTVVQPADEPTAAQARRAERGGADEGASETDELRGGDRRDPAAAGLVHTATTRHAGLFYLVGRVLELELAEHLWAAGIDEGTVLSAIGAALIGDDRDPAAAWFGGWFDRPPPPLVIDAWAVDEIGEAVQHALGRRLVHFGVVTTPGELASRLETLAAGLSLVGVHAAGPGRLIRRGAAALAVIVAARLRLPPSWELLRSVIERRGDLVCSDATLHVIMPGSAIDLDHRRAGIDHDPGHVPWLGRKVTLEFTGVSVL